MGGGGGALGEGFTFSSLQLQENLTCTSSAKKKKKKKKEKCDCKSRVCASALPKNRFNERGSLTYFFLSVTLNSQNNNSVVLPITLLVHRNCYYYLWPVYCREVVKTDYSLFFLGGIP